MYRKLDKIYDEMDSLFLAGKFEECDNILRRLNVRELETDLLLGYLTVTLPAKSKLPYRITFYSQVEEEIKRRGENEPGLFDGLR